MKRVTAVIMLLVLCFGFAGAVYVPEGRTAEAGEIGKEEKDGGDGMAISAPSAVLMEGSTGEIIFEKDAHKRLMPASITKIMTLLLVFEQLEQGKIKLTDEVTVSAHAASMGGSQVFLEPSEVQTVDTMIKCISIASANDASVAMAEHIAGSETEFVARMNQRAAELGMKDTSFLNCCGLDNDITEGHYSSAYDIALMSRELVTKHPQIENYCTVWMDTFKHVTKKGESEFGLTNTNKLIRTYKGITGLKTGSTSKAKFCLSATASRKGMDLIAVVMAAPEPKGRFQDAVKLLDYGFASCSLYSEDNKDLVIEPVPVRRGIADWAEGVPAAPFHYVCLKGVDPAAITKEITLAEGLTAPLSRGDEIGRIQYFLDKEEIGSVPIQAKEGVEEAGYKDYFMKIGGRYFMWKEKSLRK